MPWDLYLQMGHPTKAKRLSELFTVPEFLSLFPDVKFESVSQTGLPPANAEAKSRLVLTLLKGVSSPSPPEFYNMILSSHLLRHSNRIFCFDERSVVVDSLSKVAEAAAAMLPPPDLCGPLRINAFPLSLDTVVSEALYTQLGYQLSPRTYEYGVTVVAMEDHKSYRVGVSPASELFRPPSDVRNPVQDEAACAAVNKIDEALLTAGFDPLEDCRVAAIDLGAAPGAWTQYLARRVAPSALVFAVDPAKLSPEVTALPNVRHLQKRAEDCVNEVLEMAASHQRSLQDKGVLSQPSSSLDPTQLVDIIVCDINLAPRYTLPLMNSVLKALRPGGLMVLTGKFQGSGDHNGGYIDFVKGALPQMEGVKCLWLLANTSHERTYIGWKKQDGNAVPGPNLVPTPVFVRFDKEVASKERPADHIGNDVPIQSEVTEEGKFVIKKRSWPFKIVL